MIFDATSVLESFGFESLPTFRPCVLCQAETTRDVCVACHDADLKRRELANAARAALIPARYAWARVDAPELPARVKHRLSVDRLVKTILEAKQVCIAGPTKAGKTSLAVACLRERLPRCLFVAADELAAFGHAKDELARRAISVPTLLLDDLGTDNLNACSDITRIVFDRHRNGRQTWITTGLSVGQITERYGAGFCTRAVLDASRFLLGAAE